MDDEFIHIRGARENNLKNLDIDLPRGKFIVITGVSGSGKSSLAFDTLFAEGQRRYAESISAFARQFLGRMSKPDADLIAGIPPAIAISQKVTTRNPRSTVGSTTEIYDYLRLLFARIGRTYSPVSGREVKCDTPTTVSDYIFSCKGGGYALILSDAGWSDGDRIEKLLDLKKEGFSRMADASGKPFKIDDILKDIRAFEDKDLMLLIDRIPTDDNEDNRSRAIDSIKIAFDKGRGRIVIFADGTLRKFSSLFEADGITFCQSDEYLFSYNSPLGACPACGGFGKIVGIDESLVIPDPERSIYDDAVACWRGDTMRHFRDELVAVSEKSGFPIHRPYRLLTEDEKDLLWQGNGYFTGIDGFFKWVESQKYKIQYRYMLARYSGRTVCRKCGGTRLRKEALYVKLGGKNISELLNMPVGELLSFMQDLPGHLDSHDLALAQRPLKEIVQRLEYINSVGLSYLTLERASSTLSGGESQRINLVSSLGSNLVGSMYILDEPSIGLHSRDTERLISVLGKLRDLGNTVIVVEHDEQIMRAADILVDIGPGAGSGGGRVVFQGSIDRGLADESSIEKSLTLQYLSGRKAPVTSLTRRKPKYFVEIVGARENNLKNITVRFPLRCITAVTGVSGSGKSSLVGDILYPAIYRHINQIGEMPGKHTELRGDLDRISSVEYIDQNPIGKSSRSNPVTYLKIYDDIRKLFSQQPYARMNGYGHSHFSFNIDGGRCPECLGEGVIKVEMQFMADVKMVCSSCGGKRFKSDILEVRYKGRNISDVLEMSVEEAIGFFGSQTDEAALKIAEKLQPLMDVGLSYVSLGQSSSSLSGGESQRIKLASFLAKDASIRESVLFIFDEPTTGLHRSDTEKLLKAFEALISRGHSIIVVEHNLDVIRAADHIIELGPDAGDAGGEVIFEGSPQELSLRKDLPTGRLI